MTEHNKKYLSDILSAITLIESFAADTRSFSDYVSDKKTQSAVERQLGIIGEAVNKFTKAEPSGLLHHASRITGFRNRLIHAYDAIDPAIVWAIINKHLDPLKTEVLKKLEEE